MNSGIHRRVWEHLLTQSHETESAGFMFVRPEPHGDVQVFKTIEWFAVPPDGFLELTDHHFALTDQTRAGVIKRAHDLEASVVEFHSHKGPWPAEFSLTDQIGLQEFVPHIWWRLKGRPYLAVVVTPNDFDGLAWIFDPGSPQYLDGILSEGTIRRPTRLSSLTFVEEMPWTARDMIETCDSSGKRAKNV